jgi:hypothetical protein
LLSSPELPNLKVDGGDGLAEPALVAAREERP